MKTRCFLIILASVISSFVIAQTNTWDGSSNNSWSEATNWSLNLVPTINHDVVIPAGTPYCYASASGGLSAICNTLVIQSGATLRVGYAIVQVKRDVEIYGHLRFSYTDAVLDVNRDIFWKPGSTEDITQGRIYVDEDWTFEDGCNVTLGTGSLVVFDGNSSQNIYSYDANSYFGDLTVDETGTGAIWLDNASTYDIHVAGDLTITNNSILQVQANELTVDGILDIEDGSKLFLEHTGGELINNSDFILNGELDIDGGEVLIHGEFELETTGELTIDGGSFIYDIGSNNNIRGTFNMSDGLFSGLGRIEIQSTAVTDITGGIIRTNSGLFATHPGTFTPSGGTVEVVHDHEGILLGSVVSNGNYCHDFVVNCIPGGGVVFNDVNIQNDLEILSGTLQFISWAITTIGNDMNIYGEVWMKYYGTINIGNDITWFSGSDDYNLTEGTINVSGNWYFYDGTGAQLSGTNTVTFNGSSHQYIYCLDADAQFNDVVIDQSGAAVTWLHSTSTEDIHVAGDLTINPSNRLQLGTETLIVDGILDIQNTGELYLENAGGSLVNNSDLDLEGEIVVSGGDVTINGDFDMTSSGVLSISSGAFTIVNPGYTSGISGTISLSGGGELKTDGDIYLGSSSSVTMTGGTIKVGEGFISKFSNIFQPSGGNVECFGSSSSYLEVEANTGNYLYDLVINKTGGSNMYLNIDTEVKHELTIESGELRTNSATESYNLEVGE